MEQADIDLRRACVFEDLAPAEELSLRVLNSADGSLVALVSAPQSDWPRIRKSIERHFGRKTSIDYRE